MVEDKARNCIIMRRLCNGRGSGKCGDLSLLVGLDLEEGITNLKNLSLCDVLRWLVFVYQWHVFLFFFDMAFPFSFKHHITRMYPLHTARYIHVGVS
jgi:hypothetical protein